MPLDSTLAPTEENGFYVVNNVELYEYDILGYAEVNFPVYDVYGRLSRYEPRRMHRREIEKYNREHPE